LLHRVEERIIELPGNRGNFRLRWNLSYFCREPALRRYYLQHAVGVDFVIDFAQIALNGPSHGDRVPRANLPQVERVLRRRRCVGRITMAQPKFLQRGSEVVSCQHAFFCRQNHLRADRRCFFLAESDLTLKFLRHRQPQSKYVGKHASPEANHDHQHNRKATIHSFPLLSLPSSTLKSLARLAKKVHLHATHRKLSRTLSSQTTFTVKRESNPCVQSPNVPFA